MKSRIATWVPGILVITAIAGILTWFVVDARENSIPSAPTVSRAEHDPSSFDPPATPVGPTGVAASNQEPLFGEAMKYYRQRDYARASFSLRQATARQPENPEIRFFLGVSYLLTNDTRAGIQELRVAGGLGTSPYVDRIHFYLAKAFLRQKDTINAMRELDALVDNGGTLAEPAKKLKFELTNTSFE
jgi:hypothetical protein